MKINIKIGFFSLLFTFGYGFLFFAHAQKVMIDSVNKKIIVQSGDQNLDLESFSGVSGLKVSEPKLPTEETHSKPSETPKIPETPKAPEKPKTLTMELSEGTELEKAVYWMYNNGLTKYDTLSGYRPQDPLLREESAKIIGQAYTILGFDTATKSLDCSFSDVASFDPSLAPYIASTCAYGIFKGSQGKFLAQKPLTKAEALTVLVRILEGKSSSESFSPWRTLYFIKAKGISLTKEMDVNALNRSITREEIALLIYRFKKIVLDRNLNDAAKTQLSAIDANPQNFLSQKDKDNTEILKKEEKSDSTNAIFGILSGAELGTTSSLSILNSPEVAEAIQRMKDYGLTNAKDISSYAPFDYLTREQAAKMFVQFAKALHFSALSGEKVDCNFSDLSKADLSLKSSIQEICALGLMQGNKGKFDPKMSLTKAQFITMLIRLSEGEHLQEDVNPRWANYFLKGRELGILNIEDAASFENPFTRYEAALLFYRFQLKQKISSGLNTEKYKNELISTIKNTEGGFATGDIDGSYAVSLDVNLLKNQFFQEGFVEFLGTRYSLKKTTMTVFDLGEESFVWYGDLIDIAKDTKVGTLNVIVSNGNVIQGTMRFNDATTWLIKESKNTTAWFNVVKG